MMKLSKDWIEDSTKWRGKVLCGPDAHWCMDWDGLPISAFTPEYDCCNCFPKTYLGRICNRLYMQWFNYQAIVNRMQNETVAQRERWADDFK